MTIKATFKIGLLLIASATMAHGQPKKNEKEKVVVKDVTGMSIIGNNETPKSLVIVPWKNSEIGKGKNFNSSLLNQDLAPLDRATFRRELEFYRLSNPN